MFLKSSLRLDRDYFWADAAGTLYAYDPNSTAASEEVTGSGPGCSIYAGKEALIVFQLTSVKTRIVSKLVEDQHRCAFARTDAP
ncbi:MAG: hypothetical protein NZM43_13570 [Saprospiraceae bacterium]|nr:hypothetical protein [Saprospiraceae bacterium]MDW8485343.1 hypothetical protein [Saprospiraceae bacterium]